MLPVETNISFVGTPCIKCESKISKSFVITILPCSTDTFRISLCEVPSLGPKYYIGSNSVVDARLAYHNSSRQRSQKIVLLLFWFIQIQKEEKSK